jgi:Ca2+-binding EF-hand superfamily protein
MIACLIAIPAYADWRMERFDLDGDNLISVNELKASGCVVKDSLFKYADKNRDSFLDKKEAKKASEYIIRSKCPIGK